MTKEEMQKKYGHLTLADIWNRCAFRNPDGPCDFRFVGHEGSGELTVHYFETANGAIIARGKHGAVREYLMRDTYRYDAPMASDRSGRVIVAK